VGAGVRLGLGLGFGLTLGGTVVMAVAMTVGPTLTPGATAGGPAATAAWFEPTQPVSIPAAAIRKTAVASRALFIAQP
jgi:hypothetical protein